MTRQTDTSPPKKMTVMSHLRELQIRLTISATVLVIAAGLAYYFRDIIIDLLLLPLNGQKLVYLTPGGGFSFILLVSVYVGLAVAAPIAIYQLYSFVKPILSVKSRKSSLFIFLSSIALLVTGVIFGYVFAIPGALNFLYQFAGEYVEPSLTADSFLNFVVAYTLGIGLVFQLPLLLMIIHWINPLTPSGLFKSQRWVIVLSFVIAAILTPTPDPLNQTIIALPIVLIYQLGVIAVLISIYRSKKSARKFTKKDTALQPAIALSPVIEPKLSALSNPVDVVAKTQTNKSTSKPSIDGFSRAFHQNSTSLGTNPSSHPLQKVKPQRSVDGFARTSTRPLKVPERPSFSRQLDNSGQKINPSTVNNYSYHSGTSLDGVIRVSS